MTRIARRTLPGVVYHVISRFSDRAWLLRDDEERSNYLRLLGHALSSSDWQCLAYALMSSHIHLAVVAGHTSMWQWTKRVNSPFGRWMNQRHQRLGDVFADRPKMYAVLPENERHLVAYIHNNPVRAGIVGQARDSSWTSHRAYVGLVESPPWLRVADGLRRSGFDDPRQFDRWVGDTTLAPPNLALDGIHPAARRRGAVELATPTVGARTSVPLVARPFARVRPDPRRIVELVSAVCDVPATMMCSRRNVLTAVNARRVAVHAARALGIAGSDIAAALGISPQAASKLALAPLDDGQTTWTRSVVDYLGDEGLARG